jgi:hypothetical protein
VAIDRVLQRIRDFGLLQRRYAQACADQPWLKLLLTGIAFAGMLTGFICPVYFGWETA